MRGRSALLIAGLAITGSALASAPATAKPIDKGHFHDVFTSDVYNCDGTPAQDSGNVSGNFVFNQRGSSPFPYYRESVRGTVVTTNLNTGGTYTNVFTANSKDQTIVNNGDGTITITTFASGGSRFYDTNGKLVLRDPGEVRFAFDIDYNGTPGDPSDDVEIPDSFRLVRGLHRSQRPVGARLLRGPGGVHRSVAARWRVGRPSSCALPARRRSARAEALAATPLAAEPRASRVAAGPDAWLLII